MDNISKCVQVAELQTLKEKCEDAVHLFQETQLSNYLKFAMIADLLKRVFGSKIIKIQTFAVRSSSVSEDGSQTFNGGQLDTFLFVHGLENIFDAVSKCWASSVSYQVVE